MLSSLRLKDLALVENARLEFHSGLTVLTGESGSGKSVILDSLALISGAARPRLRPRAGAGSGFAEAEFVLTRDAQGRLKDHDLQQALERHGLLESCLDEDVLVLTRRIEQSGRTRCFVQGQTVSRTALQDISAPLLELCGQSEAHGLRTPLAQLEALDRFAGLSRARREVERLVRRLREQEAAVQASAQAVAEAERRRDFVEYQLGELRSIDTENIEQRQARREALQAEARSVSVFRDARDAICEGPQNFLGQLRWLCRRAEKDLSEHPGSDNLTQLVTHLDSAWEHLQEVSALGDNVLSAQDDNASELVELEQQLDELKELAHKHRISLEQLPTRITELQDELERLLHLESDFSELEAARALTQLEAEEAALALHEKRRIAAKKLEQKVTRELAQVGLVGARLEAHLARGDLSQSGISHLELGFASHPGATAESLSRVASGGELSRILLCFRLATDTQNALLTFDEIDAGAGGKTAEKIAESLSRAGKKGQVICVTHWPQVAAIADHQWAIQKEVSATGATISVTQVSGDARLEEVGRMLGGGTDTARSHAAQLLGQGGLQLVGGSTKKKAAGDAPAAA